MPEPRRWTLYDRSEDYNPRWTIGDGTPPPALTYAEAVEVMPVAEHVETMRTYAPLADECRRLRAELDEALAALKSTDSWLWNKVVNGRYGPVDRTES